MKNFQAGKTPRHGHLRRRLIFTALLVAVIILSKAVWDIYFKNQLAEQDREATGAELESLETRRDKLAAEISKLKTDLGVDEEIRKNFSVAKDGEKVITIVNGDDQPAAGTATTASTTAQIPTPSFWSRLWSKI